MRLLPLLAALLLATPLAAQRVPEWRTAPEADVCSAPSATTQHDPLARRQPVRLRFVNNGRATMSFSAPAFFRAARIRPRDAEALRGGAIRLAPGERITVALVPAAGRYRVRSANVAHRLLGMSALILVE